MTSHLLRGSSETAAGPPILHRLLHTSKLGEGNITDTGNTPDDDDIENSGWMLVMFLAVFFLCFFFFASHAIQQFFCEDLQDEDEDDLAPVTQDGKFRNLNKYQRRAILEVLFSSQPVSESTCQAAPLQSSDSCNEGNGEEENMKMGVAHDELCLPVLEDKAGETVKNEEMGIPHPPVASPASPDDVNEVTDDTTEEAVCPICLCSYEEGELLVSSKHCSHLFHKECILEWLEKHEHCPCCRVDMATESEICQAAMSLATTPPASPTPHTGSTSPRGPSLRLAGVSLLTFLGD